MVRKRPPAKPIVVKIGGSTLGAHDTTLEDLVALQRRGVPVVVVHGGGQAISAWLKKQGVESRFVRGLRVTDAEGLEVVTAVLAGLVNKELVCALNARGGRAVGLCGIDGRLIEAQIQDPDLGYVGQVMKVNLEALEALLDAGYIPVVAPVGAQQGPRAQALNINADSVAGELAAALGAGKLVFLTDVPGVADSEGRMLERLSASQAQALIHAGVASGGMIPKLEACLTALAAGASALIIDGRESHTLLAVVEGRGGGTTVTREGELA